MSVIPRTWYSGCYVSLELREKQNGLLGSPQDFTLFGVSHVLLHGFELLGGWQYPYHPGPGNCFCPIVNAKFAVYIARVSLDRVQ